jgi:hypothetical protein
MPLSAGDKLGPYEILGLSEPVEWAKCIARTILGWGAMWLSKFPRSSLAIGSSARPARLPR